MVPKQLHQRNLNHSQKGVVLIVGLVMVLLISIVALAAIKGSGLQEAMTGNARDKNIAFQAAEAGLTSGEAIVDRTLVTVAPVCPSSVCSDDRDLTPANSVIYFDEDGWTANTILTTTMDLPTNSQPRYIVEKLDKYRPDDGSEVSGVGGITEVTPYRITAKGVGLTVESTAIIQSFYHRNAD